MTWEDWDKASMALCIWREAAGEPLEGKVAIAHVILNRSRAQGRAPHAVVEAKLQFSSMTAPGDPTLVRWPLRPDPSFTVCMEVVEDAVNNLGQDPTGGATHYFNPAVVVPSWASSMVKTITIGHHDFYKEASSEAKA